MDDFSLPFRQAVLKHDLGKVAMMLKVSPAELLRRLRDPKLSEVRKIAAVLGLVVTLNVIGPR